MELSFWNYHSENQDMIPCKNSLQRAKSEIYEFLDCISTSLDVQGSKIIRISSEVSSPRSLKFKQVFFYRSSFTSVNFLSPKNAYDNFLVISYTNYIIKVKLLITCKLKKESLLAYQTTSFNFINLFIQQTLSYLRVNQITFSKNLLAFIYIWLYFWILAKAGQYTHNTIYNNLLVMDLKIKNHILSKKFISKFSYNHIQSILACIIDSADTIAFYHLNLAEKSFVQIFGGTSKPSGKKSSLAWSNDGKYLALGSHNLEFWFFDGLKMAPKKVFAQDFIELKLLAWSPDSTLIAYGGLSKKNTIKIKNVETGTTQQFSIPLSVSSISFDPFGKYLLLLLRSNFLYVYDCQTLVKLKEIPLSPDATINKNANTVKQLRGIAWSPDFSHLVCPSLDDSKVALALDLLRGNDFKVNQAFLGHISSISCAKFNPNLYEFQGSIYSILALGDSHGVLSLWRIGTKICNTPLLVLNSNNQYHQVVQDIEWDASGEVLMLNLLKRYVGLVVFDKTKFGRQISLLQKSQFIEQSYGVTSAAQINKKIQIFSLSSLNVNTFDTPNARLQAGKARQQTQTVVNGSSEKKSFLPQPINNPIEKAQYVKINQQINTMNKTTNKKRIQPAVLVRKEQAQKIINQQPIRSLFKGSSSLYSTIATHQPLNLRKIHLEPKMIRISPKRFLDFKRIQGFTILQLFESTATESLISERKFIASVDWVKWAKGKIFLLNQGNLFILDQKLNLISLPYSIGDVHKIAVNEQGDVYYLSPKGAIRGFNFITSTCYTPLPVALQDLIENTKVPETNIPQTGANNESKDQQVQSLIQDFSVQKNHNLYLVLKRNKSRYFYCRQTQSWINLELNSGLLKPGHSLRVGEHQSKLAADFFNSLTEKSIKNEGKGILSLQQLQSNMIYYKKYSPNIEQYQQNLLTMLKQLKMRNQISKLRSQIQKYFIDKDSGLYESDPKLREKVKQIGGNVIQEFILFGKL